MKDIVWRYEVTSNTKSIQVPYLDKEENRIRESKAAKSRDMANYWICSSEVERSAHNRVVVGSKPAGSTNIIAKQSKKTAFIVYYYIIKD